MAVQGPSNPLSFWKEISQDSSSGVRLVHHKLHLSFPPYYLADLKKSVKSVVDSRLIRYEQELGGILAGYGRIAILKSEAQTLFNLSDVHVDVEGDFYVFSPEVGTQLTGVVNRKSHGHLGCLVHGLFNVSLPKPYTVNAEDWLGRTAKLADEVKFTITKVDLQSQVPYIEGNIVEVISSTKADETSASKEKSGSDSGVSIASEDHLAAENSVESEDSDEEMEKKPSKLSLTQRKKEALMSKASPKSKTSPSKTKPDRSRLISDSEDSNSSSPAMGESLRLEMSEEIGNASVKSSDSDFEMPSPKSKTAKSSKQQSTPSPTKKHQKSLKVIISSSDSDDDETTEFATPSSKAKSGTTKASQSLIQTPVSQKEKNSTPQSTSAKKRGAKAAKGNETAVSPERGSASPSKPKKRKRGEDSIVQESPKSKKAKTNPAVDENDDTDVSDLVSDLFAAMSKKNIESQPGAESTPKNKKVKKAANTQEKQDAHTASISSDLASQLMKGMQTKTNTPKNAKKAKLAETPAPVESPPKKASGSPKKIKSEPGLDVTIQKIVDNYLSVSEKQQDHEPMEVGSPSKGKEKKKKAQQQEAFQTPVKPEVKQSKLSLSASTKKKAKQVESDSRKLDLDSDEGVDVSETPVIKSKKIKTEKTSTPTLKATKSTAEPNIPSTPLPNSISSLQGITPIKTQGTPVTKSAKKKATSSSGAQQQTSPVKKGTDADDDAESIIQELLQNSIRASPAVSTPQRKTSGTPSQSKGDAARKIQSSIKKKAEADDASKSKRHSLQPSKVKKLKMGDDKDSHEKTIMKILQSVQPKEKKIKVSN